MADSEQIEFKEAPTCDPEEWDIKCFRIRPNGVDSEHEAYKDLRKAYWTTRSMIIGLSSTTIQSTRESPMKIKSKEPLARSNVLIKFKTRAESRNWKRPYAEGRLGGLKYQEYQITFNVGDVVVCTPKEQS